MRKAVALTTDATEYYGRFTLQHNPFLFPIHAISAARDSVRVIFVLDKEFKHDLERFIKLAERKLNSFGLKPLGVTYSSSEEDLADLMTCEMRSVKPFGFEDGDAARAFMNDLASALGTTRSEIAMGTIPALRSGSALSHQRHDGEILAGWHC